MDTERLIAGLREHTSTFAKTVASVDPDTWVPTCPEWQLRVLVGHIGQEHRWAAEIVRTGEAAGFPNVHEADPGDPEGWSQWLNDGAAELIDAIRTTGPETTVWTFLRPQPAVFWLRRMLHDTTVHLADAAFTAGVAFEVAPDIAADTISETLDLASEPTAKTILPALAELAGNGETLLFRPSEPVPGWLITRTPDGISYQRTLADGDVTMAGPVKDLVLVMTGRRPSSHNAVAVTGDSALLDHWLAHTAT